MISRGQFLARIGGAIAAVCSGATLTEELEAQEEVVKEGDHVPPDRPCWRCGGRGVVVMEFGEPYGGVGIASGHLPDAPKYDLVEIPCPRCQFPRLDRHHYDRTVRGTVEITEEMLRKARKDPERFKKLLRHYTRSLETRFLEEASRY